jgi:hypothetical protein
MTVADWPVAGADRDFAGSTEVMGLRKFCRPGHGRLGW